MLELRGSALPGGAQSVLAGAATGTGDAMLVARLGSSEFFLRITAAGQQGARLRSRARSPSRVYPWLRETRRLSLSGPGLARRARAKYAM